MTEEQIIAAVSFAPLSRKHDNNGQYYQEAVLDIQKHALRISALRGMEKALDLGSAIFEYNQALTKHKNVSAKHIEAAAIIDAHIALQGLQHGGFSVDYEEANSRIWKFISQDAGKACANEYDGQVPASSLTPTQRDDYKVAIAFISNIVHDLVN